jgi:hypothetical protein
MVLRPDRPDCPENERNEPIRETYERYKNFSWMFVEAAAKNPIFTRISRAASHASLVAPSLS